MSLLRIVLGAAAIAAVGVAASGCGGGGGTSIPRPAMKFVNAAADGTAVDFYIDQARRASNLGHLQSTGFVNFDQGDRDVRMTLAGDPQDLWALAVTFNSDGDAIVVSYGLQNFGNEPLKRLRFDGINVSRTPPNGNKARLIVFNAFLRPTGIEPVPIDFQNPGENPQFKLSEIQFGGSDEITVDSGLQTFEARRAGTESVYATSTQTLDPGKIYFVVVTGIEGGAGVSAPTISYTEVEPE